MLRRKRNKPGVKAERLSYPNCLNKKSWASSCRVWRNYPPQKEVLTTRVAWTAPSRSHLVPPPLLGEHNDEILKELGYSDKEISELKSESIITQSN